MSGRAGFKNQPVGMTAQVDAGAGGPGGGTDRPQVRACVEFLKLEATLLR